jgi:hypothetical protein
VIDLDTYRFRSADAAALARLARVEAEAVAPRTTAVELPHHDTLPSDKKGMYVRYGGSCGNQHWGTQATVDFALAVAHAWWKDGSKPTLLVGDLSARMFAATGCHTAHKTGTHVDFDLPGTLIADPAYDTARRQKCVRLCGTMITLGARRVLYNDPEVKRLVNEWAAKEGYPGRVDDGVPGHDNHLHAEMPL